MTHQILPGSLEVEDNGITAAVHTGSNEWDIQNMRYVRGTTDEWKTLGLATLIEYMGHVYDNSTGCLVKHTFQPS